jgi:hypothetical protein
MPRIACLVPMVLLALLGVAAPAGAASAIPNIQFELEEESEDEFEDGSCAEVEEESTAGELTAGELAEICEETDEAEGTLAGERPPRGCLLRSASAHAVAKDDRLKVTIGYTTSEPVAARIEIRNGADRIAAVNRHLGRSGVLRFTENLGQEESKRIVIRIELPSTKSAGCPSRRLVPTHNSS